jgi:hypothetical protein
VFYNPLHPNEAVLERDLPKGLWGCLGIGTAVVLAIVFGGVFGLNRLSGFLSARLADPTLSPLVMAFGAFGVVIALFALVMQKQTRLATKWPMVSGTIQMSDVEQYRAAPSDQGTRGAVMYQRQVSYAYRFNDVDYTGIEARFATGCNSTSGWLMRKFMTAYQDGAVVKVYVNPLNPSEATLNPRTSFAWVLWLLAAGFGPRLAGKQSLRPQQRLDLGENPRQPVGPGFLAGGIGDQILADFDAGVDQAARFGVHGNGVVGVVAHRIGLVVADHEIAFGA